MGWVAERFQAERTYQTKLPAFWDAMRDAVGHAVEEFNKHSDGPTVDRTDCTARSNHCVRLHKASDNSTLEIFLDEKSRDLKTSKGAVCSFGVSADGRELEFRQGGDVISVDEACQKAIEGFLFAAPPVQAKAAHRPQRGASQWG